MAGVSAPRCDHNETIRYRTGPGRPRSSSCLHGLLLLILPTLLAAQAVAADAPPAKTLQPVYKLKSGDGLVPAVAYSPDGKLLLSGALIERIRAWDVATGADKGIAENLSSCSEIAFLPTLDAAACLTLPGEHVYLYGISSRKTTPVPEAGISTAIASDPATGRLVRGSFDTKSGEGTVHIVDPKTGKASAVLKGPGYPAALALSADGSLLAAGCFAYNGNVMNASLVNVWDLKSGKLLTTIKGEQMPRDREISRDPVPAVRFTPDGGRLLYRAGPRKFATWDVKAAKQVQTFDAPAPVGPAAFSPDGRLAAGVIPGDERQKQPAKLYVWDAASGKLLYDLAGGTFEVTTPAFSPDGDQVAAGTTELTLVWALKGAGAAPAAGVAAKGAAPAAAGKSVAQQGAEWVLDNNAFGPNHPIVKDMATLIAKDAAAGNDFALRFGGGLMKSGKATMLCGVGGKLFVFELAPAQEAAGKIKKGEVDHWIMTGLPLDLQSSAAIGPPALVPGPVNLKKGTRGKVFLRADKPPLPATSTLALRFRFRNGDSVISLFDYLRAPLPDRKNQLVEFAIPPVSTAKVTGPVVIFVDLCTVSRGRDGGNVIMPLSPPQGILVDVEDAKE